MFSYDSRLMRTIGVATDIFLLNVIFIISCLPIVTIGAARVALNTVMFAYHEKKQGYVVRKYCRAFIDNVIPATGAWLIEGCVIGVVIISFLNLRQLNAWMAVSEKVLLGIALLIIAMVDTYLYPLIARFDNRLRLNIKNAYLLGIDHGIITLPLMMLTVLPVCLMWLGGSFYTYGVLAYLLIAFSLTSYIQTRVLLKLFRNYDAPKNER